ncbi:hypothetical protein [Blastococcus sp. TF02A-35]|uniref:hypothetical protein n=1 Tax=Blastococcus sp. TF02A-35 TaxID=2559612 RepID=UPI001073FD14|nr:hypothetical protein [Blastococcus sp. TF02A_35]TFV45729.1 hypothetical protein E4P43_17340 [Blastococcus sp. TF02A_35]
MKRLVTAAATMLTLAAGVVTAAPAQAERIPIFGPYASLRTCQYHQGDFQKTGWTIVQSCTYYALASGSGYYIRAIK